MPEAVLRAKLTGDSAEFQRSLREGIGAAREFGSQVGSAIRQTVLEVAALTIGIEGIKDALQKGFEGVKGVFDLSKELEHLSDRTGIATKDLVQLQTEFKLSGLDAEQVGSTINRLQRSIENAADKGGEAATTFSRLGLNIAQLQASSPAQQFDMVRNAIANIESPARRSQVAMQLFGRSGAEMLSFFKNKGIGQEAANALGEQADILARNSETFQEVASLMEISGIKIRGFFVGLAEPISRVILPLLEKLEALDLTKYGEQLGTSIANAVRILYNAFEQGTLGDLFAAALEYGAAEGGNYLVAIIQSAFEEIQPIMNAIFANDDFADGFAQILTGAAGQFGAALLQAFKLPLQAFEYGMLQAAGKILEAMSTAAKLAVLANPLIGAKLIEEHLTGKRGFASETLDYVGSFAQNLQNKGDAVGDVTFDQWKKKSDKDYFLGTNAEDIGEKSREITGRGESSLKNWGASALAAVKDSIGKENLIKNPKDIFGAGDVSKNLHAILSKSLGTIPGEGKSNDPNKKDKKDGQGMDYSSGSGRRITGIHQGGGGWGAVSTYAQGPINIEGGMAGRAGRAVAPAETPDQNIAKMTQTMSDIHGEIKTLTAPS